MESQAIENGGLQYIPVFLSYASSSGVSENTVNGHTLAQDECDTPYIETVSEEISRGTLNADERNVSSDVSFASSTNSDSLPLTADNDTHITYVSRGIVSGASVGPGTSMFVFDSGKTSKVTLYDGGCQLVASGGSTVSTCCANGVKVSNVLSGGQIVTHGGYANYTSVYSNGYQEIAGGGYAYRTFVGDYGYLYVSSQGSAYSPYMSGRANAIIQGNVSRMSACDGAAIHVSSNGMLKGAYLDQGIIEVCSGGYVSSATIIRGNVQILSGGKIDSAIISQTILTARTGGVLKAGSLLSGGTVYVSSGGTALGCAVTYGGRLTNSGGSILTANVSGGSICFVGGYGSNIEISASGVGVLERGAVLSSTTVTENGKLDVLSGAVHDAVACNSGTILLQNSGESIRAILSSGGMEIISSGGTASQTQIYADSYQKVSSGGRSIAPVVSSNGEIYVFAQGTVDSATLNAGAVMWLDGTASDTVVVGGQLIIGDDNTMKNGVAYSTHLTAGGCLYVYAGQANTCTVADSESGIYAMKDSLVKNVTLNGGSFIYLQDQATATDVTIDAKSVIYAVSQNQITLSGNIALGGRIVALGQINTDSAAITLDLNQTPAGDNTYGYISDITRLSNQNLSVIAPASNGEYVLAGNASSYAGTMSIVSGTAQLGTLKLGDIAAAGDHTYELTSEAGNLVLSVSDYSFIVTNANATGEGSLANAIAQANAHEGQDRIVFGASLSGKVIDGSMLPAITDALEIAGRGSTSITIATGDDTMLVSACEVSLDQGVVVSTATVTDDGQLTVLSGAVHDAMACNGGTIALQSSGRAIRTVLASGGMEKISSGGIASQTQIYADSYQLVSAGGSSIAPVASADGEIYVFSQGAVDSATLNADAVMWLGGTASNTCVTGGQLIIGYVDSMKNGAAYSTQLTSGGLLYVFAGLADTCIANGAECYIDVKGDSVVKNATLTNGGHIVLEDQATAVNVSVDADSVMYAMSENTVTLGGNIALGGRIVALGQINTDSAVITLDLNQTPAGDNTYGYISDITSLSNQNLSVSAPASNGEYVLAGNASSYAGTVSIVSGAAQLGSLKLGDIAAAGDHTYELTSEAGNLVLSVSDYSFIVTNANATGEGSLANAIAQANAHEGKDRIVIGASLSGKVIDGSMLPAITDALEIAGRGSTSITIATGDDPMLVSACEVSLDQGVVVSTATVTDDGQLTVLSGAVHDAIACNGGTIALQSSGRGLRSILASGGMEKISSGGIASQTQIYADSYQLVSAGGSSIAPVASADGEIYVFSQGAVDSATLNADAVMWLGGTASNTCVTGGQLIIGYVDSMKNGAAYSTQLTSGGLLYVFAGLADTCIANGAECYIDVKGDSVVKNATLTNGGRIVLEDQATAVNVSVDADSVMYAASENTVTLSGDIALGGRIVALGQINTDAAVITLDLNQTPAGDNTYGYISDITCLSNQNLSVSATASNGEYVLAGNASSYAGTVSIVSGTAQLGTLKLGDIAAAGDHTYELTSEAGNLVLSVSDYSFIVTNANATGEGSLANAIAQANAHEGQDRIMFGASLSGKVIDGSMLPAITDALEIAGRGSTSITIATGDDTMLVSACEVSLDQGVVVSTATVTDDGQLTVLSGTVHDAIACNGGTIALQSSGRGLRAILASGGMEKISSGGIASQTQIYADSYQLVSAGGSSIAPVASADGEIYVFSQGAVDSATLNADAVMWLGGTASNTCVTGGQLIIGYVDSMKNGAAYSTQLTSGGLLYVFAGLADTCIANGAECYIDVKGDSVVKNATLTNGGHIVLEDQATAVNVSVDADSVMYAMSENTVTLSGNIAMGGRIVALGQINTDSAVITLDLNQTPAGDNTYGYISDITCLSNQNLSVSAPASTGNYVLAGNASSYAGTVSIVSGTAQLGSLKLGGSTIAGTHSYTLTSEYGNLVLSVADIGIAVTNTNASGEGSLSNAIALANAHEGQDIIVFDTSLIGKVIDGRELPTITDALEIIGLGDNSLTIATGDNSMLISASEVSLHQGAVVSRSMVTDGGQLTVLSGAVHDAMACNEGTIALQSSGRAIRTVLSSGGMEKISSGGIASQTQIYADSYQLVSAGGSSIAPVARADGEIYVFSQGAVDSATLNADAVMWLGGTASNTCVTGGQLIIGYVDSMKNGAAYSTQLTSGGTLYVFAGLADTCIANGAECYIDVKGDSVVKNATLTNGGRIVLEGQATAVNVSVDADSVIYAASENAVTLSGDIALGGRIVALGQINTDSAVITLDLNQTPAGDNTYGYISDITRLSNQNLSVIAPASTGQYVLAGNASSYAGTVSIVSGTAQLGTLELGGSVNTGEHTYSLASDAGNLVLSVSDSSIVVTNTDATGEGSLANAIAQANAHEGKDRIVFDASLSGMVIDGSMLPTITDDLEIVGLGSDSLTIDTYANITASQSVIQVFACDFSLCDVLVNGTISANTLGDDAALTMDGVCFSGYNSGLTVYTNDEEGERLYKMAGNLFLTNTTFDGGTLQIEYLDEVVLLGCDFQNAMTTAISVSATGYAGFRDCTVSNASDNGIELLVVDAVEMLECTATNNKRGVLANIVGELYIIDSVISSNQANYRTTDFQPYTNGAGLYLCDCVETYIQGCMIAGNASLSSAGGLYLEQVSQQCTYNILDCDIVNNQAVYGGGICVDAYPRTTALTVNIDSGTKIESNDAVLGGGILENTGYVTLTSSCSLSNNTADFGGAIYQMYSSTTILDNDSVMSGNSASSGTDIQNNAGTVISGDRFEGQQVADLGVLCGDWASVKELNFDCAEDVDCFSFTILENNNTTYALYVCEEISEDSAVVTDSKGTILNWKDDGICAPGTYYLTFTNLTGTAVPDYYFALYDKAYGTKEEFNSTVSDDFWDSCAGNAHNDSFEYAVDILMHDNNSVLINNVAISALGDQDYYHLDLSDKNPDNCEVKLLFDRSLGDLDLAIYNSSYELVGWCATANSSESYTFTGLAADDYYIQVFSSQELTEKIPYYLGINTTAEEKIDDDVYEDNDTRDTATNLGALQTVVTAFDESEGGGYGVNYFDMSLSSRDDVDYYVFSITSETCCEVCVYSQNAPCFVELYDADGTLIVKNTQEVYGSDIMIWSSGNYQYTLDMPTPLVAGDYYLKVYGFETTEYSVYIQTEAEITYEKDQFDIGEGNNTSDTATSLGILSGKSHWNGLTLDTASDTDFYTFTMADGEDGDDIEITCNSPNMVVSLSVDGKEIAATTSSDTDTLVWTFDLSSEKAGKYVLQVSGQDVCSYDVSVDIAQHDNQFNITDDVVLTNARDDYREAIANAVAWWESVITADVEDYVTADGRVIDDIVIHFSYNSSLGSSSATTITGLRDSGNSQYLPYEATIEIGDYPSGQFSVDDLTKILKHEIVHALGFMYDSDLWLSLTDDGEGSPLTKENCLISVSEEQEDTRVVQPLYVGKKATTYYSSVVNGSCDSYSPIPLQKTVSNDQETILAGSYATHWDCDIFKGEMMVWNTALQTGISPLTLYALEDLGYKVNESAYETQLVVESRNEIPTIQAVDNLIETKPRNSDFKVTADDLEEKDYVVLRQNQLLTDLSIQSDEASHLSLQDEYVFTLSEMGENNDYIGLHFDTKITPEITLYDQFGREVSPYLAKDPEVPNAYNLGLAGLAAGTYRMIVNGSACHYNLLINAHSLVNEQKVQLAPADVKITAAPTFANDKITLTCRSVSNDTAAVEVFHKAGLCGAWELVDTISIKSSDFSISNNIYYTEKHTYDLNNIYKIVSVGKDGVKSATQEIITTTDSLPNYSATEFLLGSFSSADSSELLILNLDASEQETAPCKIWNGDADSEHVLDLKIDQSSRRCHILGSGDFNLDGVDDILVYSPSTNRYGYVDFANGKIHDRLLWFGNDPDQEDAIAFLGKYESSTATVLATDDMNYDGKADILWVDGNGRVSLETNVTAIAIDDRDQIMTDLGECIGSFDGTYYTADSFLATGNFNGSTRKGILMISPEFGESATSVNKGFATWMYDDAGNLTTGWLGAMVNTWKQGDSLAGTTAEEINAQNYQYGFVGVGDFNGDGLDDIMIQNTMPEAVDGTLITGSGDIFVFLTGADTSGYQNIDVRYTGCVTSDWNVIGIADKDGDGTDDLWLCDNDGKVAVWGIKNGQYCGIWA